MKNASKLHPKVVESHIQAIEWNEYVINHFGLRLEKYNMSDYRSLDLYQGNCPLYHTGSAKITKTVNAQLHRNLKHFLELYIENLKRIPHLPPDNDFNPPKFKENHFNDQSWNDNVPA